MVHKRNLYCSYSCEWESKDPELDCENKRNCVELDGMYDCNDGSCGRIHNWTCERRCSDIDTPGKNVILMSGTLHEFICFKCYFLRKMCSNSLLEKGRSIHKTYSSAESQYHAAVVGAGKVIFAKKLHREKCQNLHILLTTK